MDLKLHNVRFYKFSPKAIHCIAYNEASKLLALSRSDNSIEIWNCAAKVFKQRQTFGCESDSIEALVWYDCRLFSAGLDGFILEYNMDTFEVLRKTAATGGPIWCLALSPDGKYLAAGTEKGFVCFFTINPDGLEYNGMDKQQGRVLSIGWHCKSDCFVTGSVDFVHLFSLKKGQILQLPIDRSKNQETIVWCVALLNDMTIVCGDSRGKTSFYNSEFGTLIDEISSHTADVLSMQVTSDQKSVYVAGVDPVIVQIQLIRTSGRKGRNMWVKGRHRRIHTHDIRTMILTEKDRLFSGGIDTYLVQSYYPPKIAIKYPATPSTGYFSISKGDRILLGYSDRLELWRLGAYEDVKFSKFLPVTKDRVKLLKFSLKDGEVLQYCSLSDKGDMLAYVVGGDVKILSFGFLQTGNVPFVKKIVLESSEDYVRCSQIHWLNDNCLLSKTINGSLQMIQIEDDTAVCDKEIFNLPENRSVMMISISGDYIACVNSENETYLIHAQEGNSWTKVQLPKVGGVPVTAIGINSKLGTVFRAYSNLDLIEYDFKNKCYTELNTKLRELINSEFSKKNQPIQYISYSDENLIYLHDSSCIYVINRCNLESRSVNSYEKSPGKPFKQRKIQNRSKENEICGETGNKCEFSSYERINHVFLASCVSSSKELVSIEFNPGSLLDSLPQPLKKKKYGAG